MKSLNHATFFQRFDQFLREADPDHARRDWDALGLHWTRSRHSYYGPEYSQTVEVVVARLSGKKGWSVMVVREGWWSQDGTDPIKTRQWTDLMSGARSAVLEWFSQDFPAP